MKTIQDFLASSKVHDASFADRWPNNNKDGPKTSFFDFSHCRLEYRLPARFETIPSKPVSQALANSS